MKKKKFVLNGNRFQNADISCRPQILNFGSSQMPIDRNKLARLRGKMWDSGNQPDASRLNAFRHITWKQSYLCDIGIFIHKASISGITGLKHLFH